MTPTDCLDYAIRPACALLAEMTGNARFDVARAHLLLLAIALQETGLRTRRQYGNGPGRGYWQFEAGGVRGLVLHPDTRAPLRALLARQGFAAAGPPSEVTARAHAALLVDDVLAAGVARLNLWWYPRALPAVGDEQGGYDQYFQVWRPGRPHPDKWPGNYATAMDAVRRTA